MKISLTLTWKHVSIKPSSIGYVRSSFSKIYRTFQKENIFEYTFTLFGDFFFGIFNSGFFFYYTAIGHLLG